MSGRSPEGRGAGRPRGGSALRAAGCGWRGPSGTDARRAACGRAQPAAPCTAAPAYLRSRGPPFYFLNHARNASRSRTASTTGGPRRACANLRPRGACVVGRPGGRGAGAEWRVAPRMRRAGRGVARGTASGRARWTEGSAAFLSAAQRFGVGRAVTWFVNYRLLPGALCPNSALLGFTGL